VWRRSWIRRPIATVDQETERLTADVQPVTGPGREQQVVRALPVCTGLQQRQDTVRYGYPTGLARLGHLGLYPLGAA
jgi:hypothetical protein